MRPKYVFLLLAENLIALPVYQTLESRALQIVSFILEKHYGRKWLIAHTVPSLNAAGRFES